MPNFSGKVNVGTATRPNTTRRGAPSEVIYKQSWANVAVGDDNGHLAAVAITAALDTTTFAGALLGVNDYARNLRYILSGAGTPAIVAYGLDQFGNVVSEAVAGNGATAVIGAVAFKSLTRVTCAALAGETLTIGTTGETTTTVSLGLDFKVTDPAGLISEGVAATTGDPVKQITVADIGTLTPGSTAASKDRRGLYNIDPTNIPDGSKDYVLYYVVGDLDT